MEKKLCHNCLGDMYPNGKGWKCRSCGVCMDANGRHYFPAPPPLTNADRIRAMSDEELAAWIVCPICGGSAWWGRSPYNNHLHSGCEKCGFTMME